ncbi:MAG: ribulokinase [Clostridiales bacterium]|nr:ribulokinase [Clostridiales bacterium]
MKKYTIGLDFGTLSARALVVEVETGREAGTAALAYRHGVMAKALPTGEPLPPDWALQHPQDYLDCVKTIVPKALAKAGVDKEQVIGIGVDFTACTLLPVDREGTPLCFDLDYIHRPHSYVKLWKHHAAQPYADRLNQLARERKEAFLPRYGGKTSSEWMFPKLWEVLEEDPALYAAAHKFVEAGDWIVWQLTGEEKRGSCAAGYKALWDKQEGYPTKDFFKALHPGLENVVEEKLSTQVYPSGTKAGGISEKGAELTGLLPGTAVAVANVDAHVALPASGRAHSADMMMIIGTSTCHVMVQDKAYLAPGMSGMVEDGIVPGMMGYEANQVTGDHFAWLVNHYIPKEYEEQAQKEGKNLHSYLTDLAQALQVGESGLLALDWWNGNRSVLVDGQLSGLILGLSLQTKPEEIYRALIEATAFGAKRIHETFEQSGALIQNLFACGGIAHKNPFMMQLYADVLGKNIRVAKSQEAPALGSAMFGAVAAGAYKTIAQAAEKMGGILDVVYTPNKENQKKYRYLYEEYVRLHDYFGRGENPVMKKLKKMKAGDFKGLA